MPNPNVKVLSKINSTTYADIIGLQFGLDRLPGETAENYVKRMETASHLKRAHPYEGALNEINLQLGFIPKPYIHIEMSIPTVMNISIAGVVIGVAPTIPLLTFDLDNVWNWRSMSDVVADIDKVVPATLLVPDGPALQLARQSNNLWAFSEEVTANQFQLKNNGILVGSEYFNQNVPPYILREDGLITFHDAPPAGLKITYNYIVTSYDIVGSPVALIGFTDPEFPTVAATGISNLAYQVREFLQTIMLQDRSYWSR